MRTELQGDDGATYDRGRDGLDLISAALRGLRYGTVTAIVQDGVVVQVERTEKFRVDKRERSSSEMPWGGNGTMR
jgi:hypothetical protein